VDVAGDKPVLGAPLELDPAGAGCVRHCSRLGQLVTPVVIVSARKMVDEV